MHYITSADNELDNDEDSNPTVGLNNRRGNYLSISTAIDFDSRLSIGCAGALLAYISRHKAASCFPDGIVPLGINRIENFNLDDFM